MLTQQAEELVASGHSAEAEPVLERALALAPDSARLLTLQLVASRKFGQAEAALSRVIQPAPLRRWRSERRHERPSQAPLGRYAGP